MTIQSINPDTIAPPAGAYTHGMMIPAGARVLHVSGQVGIRRDGTCASDVSGQAEIAWSNVVDILAEAAMGVGDIISVRSYVVNGASFAEYASVRARFLGEARPTSTSLVVSALVRPEWLVEVEVVAAKLD